MKTAPNKKIRAALDELRSAIDTDPQSSVTAALALSEKARDINDLQLKADVFHVTGRALHTTGEVEQALGWYRQALGLRQTIFDKKGMSISLNNIGLVYHDMGLFKESIPYYMEAIALKQELKEYKSLTATYENLGLVFQKLSDYKKAMEVFYKSLKISEELNDPLRMALTYQNMGMVHLAWGDDLHSFEMFKKALELRKGSTDKIPLIQLENNMGILLKNMKQYDEAFKYFEQCLQLSQSVNYRNGIMAAYNNIGETFLALGKYPEALEACLKCNDLAAQNMDHSEQCASATNIGAIYILLKEYDKAYGYLQTALVLSRKIEDRLQERNIYEYLIQVHEKKGRLAEALESYKQYDVLKSAIMSARSSDDINDLKTKYEVEKKEKEVQQAKLLQVASELKALRAQMDPHFIFNALGSMRKELLQGNIDNADRYMVRFSRLLRLILDTTRTPVVRLSDNIELLDLYIQIEQARQDNRFDYKISLGTGIHPEELYVPGLILQPLAENAVIHGLFHKEGGKGNLAIEFTKAGDILKIKVTDNGVGRKKSGSQKKPNHHSHATSIIRETLELSWKGTNTEDFFTVKDLINDQGEPAGTEVTVILPLSHGPASLS